MEPHRKPFAYYLRRTTRSPLYVQPLCWGALHLKLLRVAIETSPETPPKRSSGPPIGSLDSPSLLEYWAADPNDRYREGDLLPNIIKDILRSVEEIKDNGMSAVVLQGLGFVRTNEDQISAHSPRLLFGFSNSVTELTPEVVVTTAATKLPFLLYSTRRHTTGVRKARSLARCGGSAMRKLLIQRAATRWHTGLDPFDVACLMAMAQEQRSKLRGCGWGWGADNSVYTVYLITPNNRQSLYLFTARISPSYLDALGNVEIEVTDHLSITREIIPIPSATQASSLLVDRITEILELVYPHHQALDRPRQALASQEIEAQDEWDLGNNENLPYSDQDGWGEVDFCVEKMAELGVLNRVTQSLSL